jgi:hypothetical protein
MSFLIGASGSRSRGDYVQPQPDPTGDGIISKGAFLQGGRYGSVSMDDQSRFRSTAYVPPQQIDLMSGFLGLPFWNVDTRSDNSLVMPLNTYLHQAQPAPHTALNLSAGSGALATQKEVSVAPYGLVYNGPVSPQSCPNAQGCYLNVSGGCSCKNGETYY